MKRRNYSGFCTCLLLAGFCTLASAANPMVTVLYPNGSEVITAHEPTVIQWTATDDFFVFHVDIFVSDDMGLSWRPVGLSQPNTGSFTWFPANRPTTVALVRVVAYDNELNPGSDDSDGTFAIVSPGGGIVPTTLRDFDLPGTQPLHVPELNDPSLCAQCHTDYGQQSVEPYFNWQGSMMAHASVDPLFEACLAIAEQDAPGSGDLCLRCHDNRAWLAGRSVPTDGSQVQPADKIGVNCDLCHRMVDPIYDVGNPVEDPNILAALDNAPVNFGMGMYVIDPDTGRRRGPFDDINPSHPHPTLTSPFHRDSALCGTCHDVSNPAFERDINGNYVANTFDTPVTDTSPGNLLPIERTYSEWLNSDYNTAQGVYAPEFAGNKSGGYVASCMDCHMRDVTGKACRQGLAVTRNDLPLHDLTGGNTWVPTLLIDLFSYDEPKVAALEAGIERARYMLQNAAELDPNQQGDELLVRIINNTGHKLPTGYPEGRRMWLNVRIYDDANSLIYESGAYDSNSAILTEDGDAKIYEAEMGTDGIPGLADHTKFHFVLGNKIYKDNRIPPRGFTNATYEAFGGVPVGATYADGQFWDDTIYELPQYGDRAEITLYYQTASREYIEFLRDENAAGADPNQPGSILHELWEQNGKSPPEVMAQATVFLQHPPADLDHNFRVEVADLAYLGSRWLKDDCGPDNEDCSGTDFNGDGIVNYIDYAMYALLWLLI